MTVEHGSPLDSTETTPSDEMGSPAASPGSARANGRATIKRWIRRCLGRWRSILAIALVIAAMGLAAGLFFVQYRPDRQIDDAAAHRAIGTASDGAVAVVSYSPDNLDRDFAKAKSYLTGDFLAYYNKFTGLMAPMAQQKHITQTAKVARAAVSELHPDSAVVLVFLNQTATSKEKPEPQITPSSVQVTLTKVRGSWLIAKFDPVG